jgi:hypothetical protein
MRSHRIEPASWQMLQRMAQPSAVIDFCQDDGRFYFRLRDGRLDVVRPSTIDALTNAGLVKRERNVSPSYVISDKGIRMLKDRLPKSELIPDDVPVISNITLVSDPQHG